MPRYVAMATKIVFRVVFKKDQRCYYHRNFLVFFFFFFFFKYLLYEYSLGRFKYWKVLVLKYTKNWKIQKIVVAMETLRKISNFFYICVHHSI